jgi:hypothetical protein
VTIVNYNWCPEYSEFRNAAKKGLVTLNPTSDEYEWLKDVVVVGTRYFFFSRPYYLERVLNVMIYKERAFNKIHNHGVDLILQGEPQSHVLEAFKNMHRL